MKDDTKNEWILLLKRYKLMPDVHGETGAHNFFQIKKEMVCFTFRCLFFQLVNKFELKLKS